MSTSKTSITLQHSEDWYKWIVLVRNVAGEVWEYCNPDLLLPPYLPERPAFPQLSFDTAYNPLIIEQYKDQLRQYETIRKKLQEVRVWVGANVGEQHITRLKGDTEWQLLTNLKKKFKPVDRTRE